MLKRKIISSIFQAGIITLLITGVVVVGAVEGSAQSSSTGFDAKWNALVKAAQKEGKIVAFICCSVGRGSKVREVLGEFEKKFKIKVVNSTGSSREQWERVRAERRVGRYGLDIWMGGLRTSTSRLLPGGALQPLKPLIFHPEVLDKSAWWAGINYVDPEHQYVLPFAANARPASITYNTKIVNPKEIQSYWDLLDPKWKGKIVFESFALAGQSQTTAFFYLHPKIGPKWLRRLHTEMKPTIAPNDRTAGEWTAIGRFPLCLLSCDGRNLERQGLPVKRFTRPLKEGASLSTGGNALMAMAKAPHPNAMKLFVNWWLTREGQTLMQRADGPGNGQDSLRIDIPKDDVDPVDRRQPGVIYVYDEADPNFSKNLEKTMVYVRQVYSELKLR